MRKSVFLMFAMILTTAAVMAQSDNNPPPAGAAAHAARPRLTAEQRAKEATDKLNTVAQLTPDQYAKISDINKNFYAQRDALRGNGQAGGGEESRNQMRVLAKDKEQKIQGILNPEQQKKVQAARTQQQPHQGQGGHPGGE